MDLEGPSAGPRLAYADETFSFTSVIGSATMVGGGQKKPFNHGPTKSTEQPVLLSAWLVCVLATVEGQPPCCSPQTKP